MFRKLAKLFNSPKPTLSDGDSGPANTDKQSGSWVSDELAGRKLEVFTPTCEGLPAGCVIFLHGHGRVMLSENRVFTSLFEKHKLCAVCPDGGRSWWLDRVCAEFDEHVTPHDWLKQRLLPFIRNRWSLEPPAIALLGVSMGGQGALQLSYRDASSFPIVAAISPAVDFHQLYGQGLPLDDMFEDVEDARQATVVLNLHPLAWPRHQWFCCDPEDSDWFDGCARLGMKLSSSGILHERDLETSAGGHSWDYFNHVAPQAVEHIAAALAKY